NRFGEDRFNFIRIIHYIDSFLLFGLAIKLYRKRRGDSRIFFEILNHLFLVIIKILDKYTGGGV
ncbi:hypothetical protein, partial [Streptobacillus moniliformis]|uniref:hypothetical protein n=1 Tax=Streptobacillus moniliformis TaxID=34105 RepID=UPI000AFF2362